MAKKRDFKTVFLSGNEALAWGARKAGVSFASSYPGTPATEILEELAGFNEVEAQWAVNEKVAYEAAFGASIGGRRALTAFKHVGLNVAMDSLMVTAYTGVNAGFVVCVADDPGMHSSQNEQDTRLAAPYAKVPLVEPSSPSEAYRFIREAYRVSERFSTPVLFRLTTRVSHTKESFMAGGASLKLRRRAEKDARKYVMIPPHARPRHRELEKRIRRIALYSEKSPLNRYELRSRKIGFIASGVSAMYVKEAYPDASTLTLGMSYPFPASMAKDFAGKVKRLYVVEELEPFMEDELRRRGIKAGGRKESWFCGELDPDSVRKIVSGKERGRERPKGRQPALCPGCPHRPVFHVLRRYGAYVTGDIGCYTLGALEPLAALHTQTCMGSSIPFFEGLGKSDPGKKVVAVIGDSTFIHAGISGLVSAAYNGAKGVVIIMDNSTAAMTGAQDHPATGITLKGNKTKRLSLEGMAKAAGAENVDVVDPFDIESLYGLITRRGNEKALSVIICRAMCKMVDKSRSLPYSVDMDICKRCGECLKLGCPAITEERNGEISISPELCTGCGLCADVCGFDAIKRLRK